MPPSLTRPSGLIVTAAALAVAAASLMNRVEVEGLSMLPTLVPGDRLVVLPLPVRPGRMVVVTDPRDPRRVLAKRVVHVDHDGLEVRGDNAMHSTDSRTFGRVSSGAVRGRPLYRYSPADRAGWVLWA